jgi:uncharacterized membrane protein YfcA
VVAARVGGRDRRAARGCVLGGLRVGFAVCAVWAAVVYWQVSVAVLAVLAVVVGTRLGARLGARMLRRS